MWLAQCIDKFEAALHVIVGDDDKDPELQKRHANGKRGPHLPIIIGHARQSAQSELMHSLATVRADPHADAKNQVRVCLMLIYVKKAGVKFNHTQRVWLVLWEAGVAIKLPPWVLAAYPSALFYHFNVDVNGMLSSPSPGNVLTLVSDPDIKFVTVDGNERPTRENSRPLVEGDGDGRGSLVFFNQATMATGPTTGYNTLKNARLDGHSGTVDYGTCIQEAFEKYVTFIPVPEDVVNAA
ncbi:hypothetical protein B0H17DRAFT_1150958 [Mycena rosella]|uniref:Uncharacterized protein n=1 Tax=Mycena rosella TaxID=1033263 RepID=A0AAD7BP28_MYCRO|nr:hypothetical protein B0H17DRAFT_1150958 [Mycena rosella]